MSCKALWRRLFGFQIGDEVRIIGITDECLKGYSDCYLIGRIGRVVRIETHYLSRDTVLYPSCFKEGMRKVTVYIVHLGKRNYDYHLLEEDLELIT